MPDTIPPERLHPYGVDERKLLQYEGLKEEYYLSDFEPDPAVLEAVGPRPGRACSPSSDRRPTSRSTTGTRTRSSRSTLDFLGSRDDVHVIVIPRTDEQRRFVQGLELPSVIVPERAVDAQSLIAFSDLVVSSGGTMNREAVALGVPVYTTFGGRLGGVDEALIREGRLAPLSDPRALEVKKRDADLPRIRRDPRVMLDLLLSAC